MIFNKHETLEGKHAFLGASTYHWLRWDEMTLEQRYYSQYAQTIGTIIHELAEDLIRNKIKLAKSDKKIIDITLSRMGVHRAAYNSDEILSNLMPFVNDAIGYRMEPEVLLYYSNNCFGTSDAIGLDEYNKILRIHDYKNGKTPCKMDQLMIYAALFYLEYKLKPINYTTELRIYQNGETIIFVPEPNEIDYVMNRIVESDKYIKKHLERGI